MDARIHFTLDDKQAKDPKKAILEAEKELEQFKAQKRKSAPDTRR